MEGEDVLFAMCVMVILYHLGAVHPQKYITVVLAYAFPSFGFIRLGCIDLSD